MAKTPSLISEAIQFAPHLQVSVVAATEEVLIEFLPEASPAQRTQAQQIANDWIDPDWNNFLEELQSVPSFYANANIASVVSSRITRLASGATKFKGDTDPLIVSWNVNPPSLNQTQRDALGKAASDNGIPLTIDSENLIASTL